MGSNQSVLENRGLLNQWIIDHNNDRNSLSPITIKIKLGRGRVGREPRVKLPELPSSYEIIIVIPHTDYGGSLPLNYSNQ